MIFVSPVKMQKVPALEEWADDKHWIMRFFFLVQMVSPIQDVHVRILLFCKDLSVQTHDN